MKNKISNIQFKILDMSFMSIAALSGKEEALKYLEKIQERVELSKDEVEVIKSTIENQEWKL